MSASAFPPTPDPTTESPAVPRVDLRRSTRARRVLWTSAVVVLVPLVVLLWLQYRWQQDLERTSAIARQSALENYLGVIAKEVKLRYLGDAERVLNLPARVLDPALEKKIVKHFKKRGTPTARRYFVVDFRPRGPEGIRFYDPATQRIFVSEWNDELSAVHRAIASWRVVRKTGDPVDDTAFIVEERDRAHRMVLKPITGEDSKLVGMVGMVLDEDHFRGVVLPEVIAGALPEFKDKEKLQVSVRTREGGWVLGEPALRGPASSDGEPKIHQNFFFVFRDWRVCLNGASSAPQDWARANFAFNLTLTVVLSVLVFGGLALLLRATSREMHLSEMKNDFVSNVSHELRTPLASIRVFGELLRLGKIKNPEKVRQYGEYIEAESRRLTQLINNILDFSCIESGRKAYAFESVDLGEVVREMLDTWRIRLEHQGFHLDLEAPAHVPIVRADRDAIGQALFNLLDNAVKYSGDSKRIAVRITHDAEEAVIAVVDEGIGISRAEQKHIFDRFHRVGSGLAHDVKGSGLGLSLVQHIAAAHGGRVRVSSSLGQGSTFSLHLPLAAEGRVSEAAERALWPEASWVEEEAMSER